MCAGHLRQRHRSLLSRRARACAHEAASSRTHHFFRADVGEMKAKGISAACARSVDAYRDRSKPASGGGGVGGGGGVAGRHGRLPARHVTTKSSRSRRKATPHLVRPRWPQFQLGIPNPQCARSQSSVRCSQHARPSNHAPHYSRPNEGGTSVNSIRTKRCLKVDILSENERTPSASKPLSANVMAAGVRDEMESARDRSKASSNGKWTFSIARR